MCIISSNDTDAAIHDLHVSASWFGVWMVLEHIPLFMSFYLQSSSIATYIPATYVCICGLIYILASARSRLKSVRVNESSRIWFHTMGIALFSNALICTFVLFAFVTPLALNFEAFATQEGCLSAQLRLLTSVMVVLSFFGFTRFWRHYLRAKRVLLLGTSSHIKPKLKNS